jgi:hypothetical protein
MTTSFRAFAKTIGVSHQMVSKAHQRGRLSRSIGRDGAGRPCITDVALARREWRENAVRLTQDADPVCVGVPDDNASATDLVFAALAFVIREHARETVTKWTKDGCPREVDLTALRAWLAARGYDGREDGRRRARESRHA